MPSQHLVRIGAMSDVGRFTSVDAVQYPRGSRVIVRTARGLEIGEVLTPTDDDAPRGMGDGAILRGMTVEDELLEGRLRRTKEAAVAACSRHLSERGLAVTLLDVETMFDASKLYFYFLGEITPEIESLTAELAEVYESQAQLRKFAKTMTEGCGPGCGTEAAAGQGCATCATGCAVSGSCGTRSSRTPSGGTG